MAAVPITVPSVGESITEGILARWLKPDGSLVKAGEPLFELETDKASSVVPRRFDGRPQDRRRGGRDRGHRRHGRHDRPRRPHRPRLRHPPGAAAVRSSRSAAPSASSRPRPPLHPATAPPQPRTPESPLAPAVRRLVAENQVDPRRVAATGRAGGSPRETCWPTFKHQRRPAKRRAAPRAATHRWRRLPPAPAPAARRSGSDPAAAAAARRASG